QEELGLCVGRAYGIGTVAFRLFNIYGPRQALSNPYTGVGAIFASRLLNGQRPLVFEDGRQSRDFIHVSDIVEAFCLALERHDVADVALRRAHGRTPATVRSRTPTSAENKTELQSPYDLVCRLLLEKKKRVNHLIASHINTR